MTARAGGQHKASGDSGRPSEQEQPTAVEQIAQVAIEKGVPTTPTTTNNKQQNSSTYSLKSAGAGFPGWSDGSESAKIERPSSKDGLRSLQGEMRNINHSGSKNKSDRHAPSPPPLSLCPPPPPPPPRGRLVCVCFGLPLGFLGPVPPGPGPCSSPPPPPPPALTKGKETGS